MGDENKRLFKAKTDGRESLISAQAQRRCGPQRPGLAGRPLARSSARDYDEALEHARKAVELAPKTGDIVNTLALAEYRAGHWNESIAASDRSMALGTGGDGYDWFVLAMAHWRKGEKDEARTWFDKAVAWTKGKDPKNEELRQIWKEAADLLDRSERDAATSALAPTPAAAKPH